MQILVVDDSKAMRMIVIRELRRAGFEDAGVAEADSGRSALDHVAQATVDLILSDWNMPEMNGIELLKALRASGWIGPFGFVTTESANSTYHEALESGASFLIGKPFTADVFATEIKRALEGASAGA